MNTNKLLKTFKIEESFFHQVKHIITILNNENENNEKKLTFTSVIVDLLTKFAEEHKDLITVEKLEEIQVENKDGLAKFTNILSASEGMISSIKNYGLENNLKRLEEGLFSKLQNSKLTYLCNPIGLNKKKKKVILKSDRMLEKITSLPNQFYVDSGGLQYIRSGKDITSDVKKISFQKQRFGSIGFNFDEAQLQSVNNINFYDSSKIKDAGRNSGKNVAEQIDYIIENNLDNKVSIIIHGNCSKDYISYYDNLIDQLRLNVNIERSKDKLFLQRLSYIDSIATSDSVISDKGASGVNFLIAGLLYDLTEHLKANNRKEELEIIKKVHFLGVGASSKLVPFKLIEDKNGSFISHYTFDSSSALENIRNGNFTLPYLGSNGKLITFNKTGVPLSRRNYKFLSLAYDIVKEFIKPQISSLEEYITYSGFEFYQNDDAIVSDLIKRYKISLPTTNGLSKEERKKQRSKEIKKSDRFLAIKKKKRIVTTSLVLLQAYCTSLEIEMLFKDQLDSKKLFKGKKQLGYIEDLEKSPLKLLSSKLKDAFGKIPFGKNFVHPVNSSEYNNQLNNAS